MMKKPDYQKIAEMAAGICSEICEADPDYLADFFDATGVDVLGFSTLLAEMAHAIIKANEIYEPVRVQQMASNPRHSRHPRPIEADQ